MIKLSIFIGLLIAMLTPVVNAADYVFPAYSGQTDARSTDDIIKDFTKSGEDINNNLTRPMMSADPITTFDNKTFNAQMSCPASEAYLELLIAPGSTGDITTFNLKQDTDIDGVFDYIYSPSFHVSGVCANGVISCDANTWNNCQAYQWEINPAKQATLTATGLAALGGCYCVNNSCGSALVMTNLSSTLGDLAGGVVARLANQNPAFSVSKVDVNGPVITYYGQNAADCGMTGTTGQETYFSDPSQMAANATSTAQLDSMFNLVTNSVAAADSGFVKKSCTLSRTIGLDEVTQNDIIMYNGGAGGLTSCGIGCMQLVLGTASNHNYWSGTCSLNKHEVSFWVTKPERILSATLTRAQFDDHIQISNNGSLIFAHHSAWTDLSDTSYPPGTYWHQQGVGLGSGDDQFNNYISIPYCERDTIWSVSPNKDFTNIIKQPGQHNFKIRVAVSGGGQGYAHAQIMVDESCYLLPEAIINSCSTYEADPTCRLEQETVDGVNIFKNYNPTGLVPLANTREIVGSTCTKHVNKPWWTKERTYHCDDTSSFDFTNVFERSERIRTTASASGYDDYRLDEATGQWNNEVANVMQLPDNIPVADCVQACKTKKTITANDVAGLGVTGNIRTIPTTTETNYYECNHAGVCPAGTGETITTACQCMNNFAEATAIIQSMRMAGRDLICTSGIPSPL